jgi:hypothetical protein
MNIIYSGSYLTDSPYFDFRVRERMRGTVYDCAWAIISLALRRRRKLIFYFFFFYVKSLMRAITLCIKLIIMTLFFTACSNLFRSRVDKRTNCDSERRRHQELNRRKLLLRYNYLIFVQVEFLCCNLTLSRLSDYGGHFVSAALSKRRRLHNLERSTPSASVGGECSLL